MTSRNLFKDRFPKVKSTTSSRWSIFRQSASTVTPEDGLQRSDSADASASSHESGQLTTGARPYNIQAFDVISLIEKGGAQPGGRDGNDKTREPVMTTAIKVDEEDAAITSIRGADGSGWLAPQPFDTMKLPRKKNEQVKEEPMVYREELPRKKIEQERQPRKRIEQVVEEPVDYQEKLPRKKIQSEQVMEQPIIYREKLPRKKIQSEQVLEKPMVYQERLPRKMIQREHVVEEMDDMFHELLVQERQPRKKSEQVLEEMVKRREPVDAPINNIQSNSRDLTSHVAKSNDLAFASGSYGDIHNGRGFRAPPQEDPKDTSEQQHDEQSSMSDVHSNKPPDSTPEQPTTSNPPRLEIRGEDSNIDLLEVESPTRTSAPPFDYDKPPSPAHSTDPREVEVMRPHLPQAISQLPHSLPKTPLDAYPEEFRDTADEGRSHDASLAGVEGREETARFQYSDEGTQATNDIWFNSPSDLTGQVTKSSNHPFASGGFGDIYKGNFNMRGRLIDVAIKTTRVYLQQDQHLSKKKLKQFRREITVWWKLEHPNVLPLLGTIRDPSTHPNIPAMVCPWVENGALSIYLERNNDLTVAKRLVLVHDVARGLQYLHSQHVVHGDLSGSNVLIHGNGRACIADFGLSTLLTRLGGSTFATTHQAKGTTRWMAPELLDLDDSKTAPAMQSDVYSFGSIMLQILTGSIPYHYLTRNEQVILAIARGTRPKRPDEKTITDHRWKFIEWCWSPTDAIKPRPSSDEIIEFTKKELGQVMASEV